MLVLTRCQGQEIVIDGRVRVTILAVRRKRVRIGVSAPASVRVDRDEIDRLRNSHSLPHTCDALSSRRKS
jgi:carbon storage regulator